MSLVETEMTNGVLTVTLNDPENRNALSSELTSDLVETLDAADHDPEVRVVVLTNSGKVFAPVLIFLKGLAGINLPNR